MTQQEYEKARQECWDAVHKELLKDEVQWQPVNRKEIVNFVFDRAYALGREKETITQEEIEDAAEEFADKEYMTNQYERDALYKGYYHGMKDALGKQEKGAEGEEEPTRKEAKENENTFAFDNLIPSNSTELKSQEADNQSRNLSQATANCDKVVDNILKGSLLKERRLNIAAMVMQGIVANQDITRYLSDLGHENAVAAQAILYADALIDGCESLKNMKG